MALIDDVGFLCLTIDSGEGHEIVGRTKLQKIVYFCQYLGWDVDDYKLHYYGPFSFGLVDTIKTAENIELINQGDAPPYTFSLTDTGTELLNRFEANVCDADKVERTRDLVTYLSEWDKEDLEIAATIDFVNKNNPRIGRDALLNKVAIIKENYPRQTIENAHELWINLRRRL